MEKCRATGSETKLRCWIVATLRAGPEAERVLAGNEDFLNLNDPADLTSPTDLTNPTDTTNRDGFRCIISYEPGYRLTDAFRHLNDTFNKLFALAW